MSIEPIEGNLRPIIILGVDRSGTSLVASMTAHWGAYAGEDEVLGQGDQGNPQGYWEYGDLKPFVDELLASEKISVWHPTFRMLVKERAQESYYREKAESLVAGMEKKGRPWFWKEPDLSLALPFWKQFWKDPVYVVTVRNPYDSAVSWKKFVLPEELHDRYSLIAANLLRWQFYLLAILADVDSSKDKIFIQYEDLLRDPQGQAVKLDTFLSQRCGVEPGDEGRVDRMAALINPDLWRNKSSRPLARVPQATKEQKSFYELLKRKVNNPDEPVVAARYPMYAGYWEYLEMVDTLL